MAADAFGAWTNGLPTAWVEGPACDPWVDYNCTPSKAATAMALKAGAASGFCDPYLNYKCLDQYLGDDVFTRFFRYYQLEWGKGVAPADPNAPAVQPLRRCLASDAGVVAADAVRRMALRRHGEYRQDLSELGRLAVDGRASPIPRSARR